MCQLAFSASLESLHELNIQIKIQIQVEVLLLFFTQAKVQRICSMLEEFAVNNINVEMRHVQTSTT